jgi:hypothetical protein
MTAALELAGSVEPVWYNGLRMTKLAEILERVQRWPAQRQEDVVQTLMRMEEAGTGTYQLSEEERCLIDEALASPFMPEDDMEKFWNRHAV